MDAIVNKALDFATRKHEGQKRKNGEPYIVHPTRVAEIVRQVKIDSKNLNDLVAAAFLHDTIEDTDTSYKELEREFGGQVASLVMELSSAPFAADYLGKAQYLCGHMVYMTTYALVVKLADRLDNILDMKGFSTEKKMRKYKETLEIINFIEKNRKLTKTHEWLIHKIKTVIDKELNDAAN